MKTKGEKEKEGKKADGLAVLKGLRGNLVYKMELIHDDAIPVLRWRMLKVSNRDNCSKLWRYPSSNKPCKECVHAERH